jgi:TetR/AcrR family transcriptional repressor of nem operon
MERPKRERLIDAAASLMHENGVERTTLAEVADVAAVPPGNVYYYFKTRDELVSAIIEKRSEEVRELLDTLNRRRTPAARLKGLSDNWYEARELAANHGCPIGTLSTELAKRGGGLDEDAGCLLGTLVDWAEEQFREMGRSDARDLALSLLSGVQGAALLANALRDPSVMASQVRILQRWIDSIAAEARQA